MLNICWTFPEAGGVDYIGPSAQSALYHPGMFACLGTWTNFPSNAKRAANVVGARSRRHAGSDSVPRTLRLFRGVRERGKNLGGSRRQALCCLSAGLNRLTCHDDLEGAAVISRMPQEQRRMCEA